jgi:hypothetical protein
MRYGGRWFLYLSTESYTFISQISRATIFGGAARHDLLVDGKRLEPVSVLHLQSTSSISSICGLDRIH